MRRNELIEIITKSVAEELLRRGKINSHKNHENTVLDIMKTKTTARIGVGKAGPRLRTDTLLKLREDHAKAKDAVMAGVNSQVLDSLKLFQIKSLCRDIDEHLTRPDLGRQLDEDAVRELKRKCKAAPQVQIYVSDGLSNSAVEQNVSDILPAMINGLEDKGIEVGTPFFVKYGRVPTMDVVSEVLNAEVTCVLIGERPGLAAADSMSAYIAYRARVGMAESRRTVISNIHENGIQPVEAGAYAVSIIEKMLSKKTSGVDLKL